MVGQVPTIAQSHRSMSAKVLYSKICLKPWPQQTQVVAPALEAVVGNKHAPPEWNQV